MGFTTIKNVKTSGNNLVAFLMIFENTENNELGGRFIDLGLQNVAVAAARVVELHPRCSLKGGGQKRRCLQNACDNHLSDRPTYGPTQKFAEEVAPAVNFPRSWELGRIYVRTPHSKLCVENFHK